VAELFGKSIGERAHALIQIAAPEFRAELTAMAQQLHLP
jgi:acyl-CoA hydrolase